MITNGQPVIRHSKPLNYLVEFKMCGAFYFLNNSYFLKKVFVFSYFEPILRKFNHVANFQHSTSHPFST